MEKKKKVLILIVSYNAEKFIESVLDRIPTEVWESQNYNSEILIIDDASKDHTFFKAQEYLKLRNKTNLTVLFNPINQGYGGNQKIGYHYAIQNKFDVVVMLHGDGQYAPEMVPQIVAPLLNGTADAVFGSRMIHKMDALKGKMPLYKWIGNQVLTFCQNLIMGSHLSEFHSGYRAYSVPALASLPFQLNSDYFDFDTDIIIQFLGSGKTIQEIPIPTYYGEEICRVNGVKYGLLILISCLLFRFQKFGIFYLPKFDFNYKNEFYVPKFGYSSSHQFAIDQVRDESTVIDIGSGPGYIAQKLQEKKVKTISIDKYILPDAKLQSYKTYEADINTFQFDSYTDKVDTILLLDIIEHLKSPESLLLRLRERHSSENPKVVITTGNIAFLFVRLSLLFGKFNYGKKGILDLDHSRLFTFASLQRTLQGAGYEVQAIKGIPAPFPLAFGKNWFSSFLLMINQALIKLSKGLFSYQIAVVAVPKPTLQQLLANAYHGSKEKMLSVPRSPQPAQYVNV